jgi:hypothetical protein
MDTNYKTPMQIANDVKKLGEIALNEKLPQEDARQKVLSGLANNADLLKNLLKDRLSGVASQEDRQRIEKAIQDLENVGKEFKTK